MTPTLHLIFKTHLDLGFTSYASTVRAQYHDHFIPMALATGEHFLREGNRNFIWTTGSWLIWDHLETQSPDKVRRLEKAIENGIIRWHALPFTTHTELMSERLFREGIGIARELDTRFGLVTKAAKMTDVPGHTIGAVPAMADMGIRFLHIGVNTACPLPEVPPIFRWRASDGSEVVVMYQGSYGGMDALGPSPDRVAFAHTNDNVGPQGVPQVADAWREAEHAVPGFTVKAATLDDVWTALEPHLDALPVVTEEIGDTWIHGIGSAPDRVRRFAHAKQALIAANEFPPANSAYARKLIEVAEHTWGVDIKTYLRDNKAWDRADFDVARKTDPRFAIAEGAWAEQDAIVYQALALLPEGHPVAAIADISLQIPETGFAPLSADPVDHGGMTFLFDPVTGGVRAVRQEGRTILAARAGSPGLFAFSMLVWSAASLTAAMDSYLTARPEWALLDHGKPGLERAKTARDATFLPVQAEIAHANGWLWVRATMPEDAVRDFGAPHRVTTGIFNGNGSLQLALHLSGKSANRMPEVGFWHLEPQMQPGSLHMVKMGVAMDPRAVVRGGNRQLHAVEAVSFRTENAIWSVSSTTAPLFQFSSQPFLAFSRDLPDPDQGGKFNLFNNKWGTNFSMWSEGDMWFQMHLSPTTTPST